MSIASRISAIEEHLEDDYSVLTLAGADLTNVDKNIINLKPTWQERLLYFMNNGTDVVWNNWDKVVGEGESLSLNNTLEAKMKIDLKGNTYQYSTSGNQLFDKNKATYGLDKQALDTGVRIIATGAGQYAHTDYLFGDSSMLGKTITLKVNIKVSASNVAQIYFFFGNDSSHSIQAISGSQVTGTGTKTITFTIPNSFPTNADKIWLLMYVNFNGTASIGDYVDYTDFMINEGSSSQPYEEYTGGIASPNPSYPQDIQVVSGDNTIKVEGKNIASNVSYTDVTRQYYPLVSASYSVLENQYYAISFDTPNSNIECYVNYTASSHLTGIGSFPSFVCNGTRKTFIAQGNANATAENISIISRREATSETGTGLISNFMIEKISSSSGTATTYEPYVSQTYPINLGEIELCKIGTYQDKIAKSSGSNFFNPIYVVNNATVNGNNITLTGSTDFYLNGAYSSSTNTLFTIPKGMYRCITTNDNVNLSIYGIYEGETTIRGINSNTTIATDITGTFYVKGLRVRSINGNSLNGTTINVYLGTQTSYEPYGTSWYLNKQIGKVVLNGSETNWTAFTNVNYEYQKLIGTGYGANGYKPSFSNRFTNNNVIGANLQNYQYSCFVEGTYMYLRFRYNEMTTLQEFKNWLTTNNVIAYYILATPTYETITDTTLLSQLNALGNANSYNNQTNINQDNNDLASILNATALKEME